MKSVLIYAAGLILSIVAMFVVMPHFIAYLKKKNINQVTSEYALEEFKQKEKTPIMGGLLFVVLPIIVFAVLDFTGLADKRTQFVLLSYILYCSVGFIDDSLVIRSHSNEGLSPKTRLIMEFAYTAFLFFVYRDIIPCHVTLPSICSCDAPAAYTSYAPARLLPAAHGSVSTVLYTPRKMSLSATDFRKNR